MKILARIFNVTKPGVSTRVLTAIFLNFCLITASSGQNKNWSIGPLLATNGFGVETNASISQKDKTFSNQLSVSLRTLKHEKEVKIQNPRFTNPKPYVYGKLNTAFVLDLGIARCKTIGSSSAFNPKFLLAFQAGPSLGITKPYYVYIHKQDDPLYKPIETIQTQEVLTSQESILGAANWSKGFDQLDTKLGIHCDINLQIIWDKIYRLQRLKSGVRFDYFFDDLEILYDNKNNLFASFYTSYQIGKNK